MQNQAQQLYPIKKEKSIVPIKTAIELTFSPNKV